MYNTVFEPCCEKKTAFCICENKEADQLRGNCEAEQRLCFRYIDSIIPLLPIYERTYDTLGDICPVFERPELCFKAAVTILVW